MATIRNDDNSRRSFSHGVSCVLMGMIARVLRCLKHFCYIFFQVVWRNSKQIGAAWAIRKDKRLVIAIKYHPGGNYGGYYDRNVFRPIATTLGPPWPHSPPKFTRCPAKFVQTPDVKAAAGRVVTNLRLFIGAFIFTFALAAQ